jgi:hypothetical protein
VSSTEATIAECEEALGRYISPEETQRLSTLMEAQRHSLHALEKEWSELSEELDTSE